MTQSSKGLRVEGNYWFFVVPPVALDTRATGAFNELVSLEYSRSV